MTSKSSSSSCGWRSLFVPTMLSFWKLNLFSIVVWRVFCPAFFCWSSVRSPVKCSETLLGTLEQRAVEYSLASWRFAKWPFFAVVTIVTQDLSQKEHLYKTFPVSEVWSNLMKVCVYCVYIIRNYFLVRNISDLTCHIVAWRFLTVHDTKNVEIVCRMWK